MTRTRSLFCAALALVGCDASMTSGTTDASVDARHASGDASRTNPRDGATTPIITGDVVTGVYDVPTSLPGLPPLQAVRGTLEGDGVSIRYEPFEGARDYRVYALPNDAAIHVSGDSVAIDDALYRCAGARVAPSIATDGEADIPGAGMRATVAGPVYFVDRTMADATLGHVYVEAGAGRLPVYALGDPAPSADNQCFWGRWGATRSKIYTTDEGERARMLAEGWRDDGIAFYAPAEGAGAHAIYLGTVVDQQATVRFYYRDGAERATRGDGQAMFHALDTPADGTQPLMRVYYSSNCGAGHDELVRGAVQFELARHQGPQPLNALTWSGVTEPTTLVIEALDSVCPWQGRLASGSIPAFTSPEGVTHQAALTLDEVRASSVNGEVFINGQSDATTRPRAIARAFLRVEPRSRPQMDWFAGFEPGTAWPPFHDEECGALDHNCFQMWRQRSSDWDVNWHTMDTGSYVMGPVLGELWVGYSDWAADTNGKFRLSPLTTAHMDDADYLHVTMEVDAFSTARRYPQILVSDGMPPVQYALPSSNTILLQTRADNPGSGDWPIQVELQICDHRTWDVNQFCPGYHFHTRRNEIGDVVALQPTPEVGEQLGMDRRTRFDLFVSSSRAYILLDSQPFGCVDLPAAGIPHGEVSITFGDVLYHSGVDGLRGFTQRHLQTETQRHFDNLGFSSRVPPPAWDEVRFPCLPPSAMVSN